MSIIPYGRQEILEQDIQAVIDTLKSDFLTQGPQVKSFEDAFASYVGSRYAVAVSNGTAALHLGALALGVQPGDKVITTPITFAASANAVLYAGGEIVFADIDPETYLLDINKVRELLDSHPKGTFKGIIPVDFTGYPADLEAFRKLADEYGLWVMEDACHSPGGGFMDSGNTMQLCGNGKYADVSVFSFHPVKHIAAGEGGMITTDDKKLYDQLMMLRTHGITKDAEVLKENHGGWYYEMHDLGYNYRITDFQAALGNSQLDRAEEGIKKRQQIAARYDEAFTSANLQRPVVADNIKHAYHLYVIQVEDRHGLYEHLRNNDIFAQVHYIPVHTMPYYQKKGWKKGDMPVAEKYYERCLSLPMFPSLTEEQQSFVIEKVLEFVK